MSDGPSKPNEALNLPEPKGESAPYKVESQSVNEVMSELTGSKNTELATSVIAPTITPPASSLTPVTTPSDDPAVQMVKINDQTTDSKTPAAPAPAGSSPQIADDQDLIEKEWVDKAKQIVERTKADPHSQIQEIGLYKAEYIKKRFNKDVKTAPEG